MNDAAPLRLFEGYGVELEYMIVDGQSLSVLPAADEVLRAVAGQYVSDVELDEVAWSNELVLHVIELKTNGPSASLEPLPRAFQDHVCRINTLLAPLGGRLMPTAMHPWMDPTAEMRLWPHDFSPIYQAYDRIFDCRGHGWANLQSVHLNLPFGNDEEFGRLHAAIRLVLPIMPALAASSPIVDRRPTGLMDTRLDVYQNNARRIPSITAGVVPEPVFTRRDYEQLILQRMYDDIRPLDPEGVLQHEFLNARGAIARFDRSAIEIRVLDAQECPAADVAVCGAVAAAVRALVEERWMGLDAQQAMATDPLRQVLIATTRDADQAVIRHRAYLDLFGVPDATSCTAGELWQHLCEATCLGPAHCEPSWGAALRVILRRGPLARRILASLDGDTSFPRIQRLYADMCESLAAGNMFLP